MRLYIKFFFILSITITIIITFILGWNIYKERRERYLSGQNVAYPLTFNLDKKINIQTIYLDYSKQIASGSPLIFGGSNPRILTDDAWEKIDDSGVTAVRVPLFVEHSVPNEITIEEYANNISDIQNPDNWNQEVMNKQTESLVNAKRLGMTTIGVMQYSPEWLNYSKTPFGVPRNWEVYKDIVKKMYARNREYLDYVEIWNEPDWVRSLDIKESNLSREDAYVQIYLNTAAAIKEYDKGINDGKIVKIGGPAISKIENEAILRKIISSKSVLENLDFISVHNYENHAELDITIIREIIESSNRKDLPIFLTEWSYTSDSKYPLPQLISSESIPFTGRQFIKMFQQEISAAFIFALQPVENKNFDIGHGYLAYYRIDDSKATLLPQAKTWYLFSKTMKLGDDVSKVFFSSKKDDSNIIAMKNIDNENIILVANSSNEITEYDIEVKIDSKNKHFAVDAYVADDNSDPQQKRSSLSLKAEEGILKFKIFAPALSTIGLKINDAKGLIL